MRKITDHRFDHGGFDQMVQRLVRNAPWWLISLALHGVALLILWNLPVARRAAPTAPRLQAELTKQLEPPEEVVVEPPEPDLPPEDIVEKVETFDEEDEVTQDDADSDLQETLGEAGEEDAPFSAPYAGSAIGVGPGAGGGPGGRGGSRRARVKARNGLHDNAVLAGLQWLAKHQDVEDDGRWDCDDFMKHDDPGDRCDGPGNAMHDVGVTGLALLAFLGAGYDDRTSFGEKNRFARNVRRGLRFLMRAQDEDGVFGSRAHQNFMYDHAIATLAMSEAFWLTRNPRYKKPAQQGLNFIAMARNPYLAWRYEPRGGDNDTSVTGWCIMALKSGKFAGLNVDPAAFAGARLWIDKMTDPTFGQVGYNFPGGSPARPEGKQERFPAEKSQSMTAVGMLTRIFLGEDPRTSPMIKKGAALCLNALPVWNPDDGSIDMYYWYYATLALFQVGNPYWRKWNEAMAPAIVSSQHPKGSGSRSGSWDPIGAWGDDGGRVYATATMVMCLEIYYRYDRVFR